MKQNIKILTKVELKREFHSFFTIVFLQDLMYKELKKNTIRKSYYKLPKEKEINHI
jgi:hypothetical protein